MWVKVQFKSKNDYFVTLFNISLVISSWVNCDNKFFNFISLVSLGFNAFYLFSFIFTMYAFLFELFLELYIIFPCSSYTVNEIDELQYSKPSYESPQSS